MAYFTFTINGHEYTSDPANNTALDGYRFIKYGYVTALANLAQDIVAVATQVLGWSNTASNAAGTATTKATEAALSASSAADSITDAAAQVALATAQKQLAADWAAKPAGTVDGVNKSAKQYAQEAAAYAASVNLPALTPETAGLALISTGTEYELGNPMPGYVLQDLGYR